MRIILSFLLPLLLIFFQFTPTASAQSTQEDPTYTVVNIDTVRHKDYLLICYGFQHQGLKKVYSTDDYKLYSNGIEIPFIRDNKVALHNSANSNCVRYFYGDYNNFYNKTFTNLSFREGSIHLFNTRKPIKTHIPNNLTFTQSPQQIQRETNTRGYVESRFKAQDLPQIRGCTDQSATNYNPEATQDDGSCTHPVRGCTDKDAINYNPQATQDDGSCQARVEGCTDPTATNYNPNANIHMEDQCIYPALPPTPSIPQDITGYITTSQVSSGATSWTSTVTLNVTDAALDYNSIQLWDQFIATSATTEGNKIIITFRKFNNQRLDVECNNYEYTIPREAITTENGSKNINPITGNFTVVGCKDTPTKNENEDDENQNNNKQKHENTIKEDNFYLSLYDTDEKGKVYINLTSVVYILGFLAFFSILFFVLFGFLKNSFLGRSKK